MFGKELSRKKWLQLFKKFNKNYPFFIRTRVFMLIYDILHQFSG